MMTVSAILVVLATTLAAAAQDYVLPTLFDVTGVAADDVLNIRAEPDAGAEVIGTLAPNARRIEVVARDQSGDWGQVNTDGRSGWASLHYLTPRAGVWEPGELPQTLSCTGTEPFWSLTTRGDSVTYSTPENDGTRYRVETIEGADLMRDPRRSVVASTSGRRLTAVLVPASCSDGMSNRAYGLDATLVLERDGELRVMAGCCSVAP